MAWQLYSVKEFPVSGKLGIGYYIDVGRATNKVITINDEPALVLCVNRFELLIHHSVSKSIDGDSQPSNTSPFLGIC